MKTSVTMPAYTVQTITSMLSNKEGVCISPIIDALAPGRNKDLVTLQCALLLKGVSQQASSSVRYKVVKSNNSWQPQLRVYRYDYKNTAIFDEKVEAVRTLVYVDFSNMSEKTYSEGPTELLLAYDEWENDFLNSKELYGEYPDAANDIELGFNSPQHP